MNRWVQWGFVLVMGGSLVACEGGTGGSECRTKSDCPRGQTCLLDGGCVPSAECTPESCTAGTFCSQDLKCVSVESACNDSVDPCECHIANGAGEFVADDVDSVITLTPGAQHMAVVSLGFMGGTTIPSNTYSYGISGTANTFSIDEAGMLTAGAAAGEATLTATAASGVTCTAKLVNLGASGVATGIRVRVFNDRTGLPVAGARIVIDTNNDGLDDGFSTNGGASAYGTTNASGVATTTQTITGTYALTVFHSAHHYVSLVGLSTNDKEVSVPLASVIAPVDSRKVAGFSGVEDFIAYRRNVLNAPKDTPFIEIALVAGSFPLRSIVNFDLSMLTGDKLAEGDCAILDVPTANKPCLPLPSTVFARAAGGFLRKKDASTTSPRAEDVRGGHVDVTARPGRRYAWMFGGAVYSDLLFRVLADYKTVLPKAFNGTAETFDVTKLNFNQLATDIHGLIPALGIGSTGNLNLPERPVADWNARKGDAYFDNAGTPVRRPSQDFHLLDTVLDGAASGEDATYTRPSLTALDGLQTFTTVKMPSLPMDTASNQAFEGMVLLTGIDSKGYGFVPMGLGLGLDCLNPLGCGDSANRASAAHFDGHVTGATVCRTPHGALDGNNRPSLCPVGAPFPGSLRTDEIGMFRSIPRDALASDEWVTVAVALPITSLLKDGLSNLRARAAVLRGDAAKMPGQGTKDLSGLVFAPLPMPDTTVTSRVYEIKKVTDLDAHWIMATTIDAENSMNTVVTWNIYASPSANTSFKVPAVPAAMRDPFTAPSVKTGKYEAGELNLTHLGFNLIPDKTLQGIVSSGNGQFADLLRYADGFSGGASKVTDGTSPIR